MRKLTRFAISLTVVALLVGAYFYFRRSGSGGRGAIAAAWLTDPKAHPDWAVQAGQRCGDAPFVLPTNGRIGFLWDDSFRPGHRHAGLDIFGGTDVGITPVVAAYDGYLTRLADWKSTVIIRIPSDPLMPGRQIWMYYTHMATAAGESFVVADFPPGSVTHIPNGRFYLARLADGGFVALYQRCTHLGCTVPWDQAQNAFVCPCHNSQFGEDGAVHNPPAPRPLDLFAITIVDGQVQVDTSRPISRDQVGTGEVVYA